MPEIAVVEQFDLKPTDLDLIYADDITIGIAALHHQKKQAKGDTTSVSREAKKIWANVLKGEAIEGFRKADAFGKDFREATKLKRKLQAGEARELQLEPLPKLVSEFEFEWTGRDTLKAFAGLQSRGGGYTSRDSASASDGTVTPGL